MSVLGGHERKVADIVTDSRPAWSPDSKSLLVASKHRDWQPNSGDGALFVVPIENGSAPRAVLHPPPGVWYKDPACTPGARVLAFAACSGSITGANCGIEVDALNSDGLPSGEQRRITEGAFKILGLTWTLDASALIYSSQKNNDLALWRVDVQNPNDWKLPASEPRIRRSMSGADDLPSRAGLRTTISGASIAEVRPLHFLRPAGLIRLLSFHRMARVLYSHRGAKARAQRSGSRTLMAPRQGRLRVLENSAERRAGRRMENGSHSTRERPAGTYGLLRWVADRSGN